MKNKLVGYTTGVFDMFHIGHLNILRNAKSMCDHLIVGVTTDELVSYKGKQAIIPFKERIEIVRNIGFVDTAIPQSDMEKMDAWKKLKFNRVFVGDDWFGHEKWKKFEADFNKVGVDVIYFPYTEGTSSTLLAETLKKLNENK